MVSACEGLVVKKTQSQKGYVLGAFSVDVCGLKSSEDLNEENISPLIV